MHIERFSDRKETMFTRDSLSQVLMLDNFPKELVQGVKIGIDFDGSVYALFQKLLLLLLCI